MADKPKGYYSPEAIQARQQVEVDTYNREQAKKKKEEKPVKTTGGSTQANFQTPTTNGIVAPPKLNDPKFNLPPVPQEKVDVSGDWNWQNAKTDKNGKPLETRKFLGVDIKPEGFDPMGNPYFGPGVEGWAKKWAYKVSEERATEDKAKESWKGFWETANQFSKNVTSPISKNATQEEKTTRAQEQGSLFLKGVGELFSSMSKQEQASGTGVITTPILKIVNATVGSTLEAFGAVADTLERGMGAQRNMREYATDAGSILPALTIDDSADEAFDKNMPIYATRADERIGLRSEAADVAFRLFTPALQFYDTVRFWTAPGTVEEKMGVVKLGWTEGQMLYTELYKSTVRSEYTKRVQAGEDPDRLAMELQDPWVEAIGEIILDPLNVIGMGGKASKAALSLSEAADATKASGALIDIADDLQDISKAKSNAEAAIAMSKIEDKVIETASRTGRMLDSAQSWKATALSPDGNRFNKIKGTSNYLNTIVQGIRNNGGGVDDVMDYVAALAKRASGDKELVRQSIATFSHSPFQTLAYNQAAFDTGHMLSQLIGDGEGLIKAIKASDGTWSDLTRILDDKMRKAVDFTFPSVKEMSKAADKAKELAKVGEVVDPKTQRLAEAYKKFVVENPGVAKWSKVQAVAESIIRPINGALANSYFSLSYGYAFRNFTQNMFTLFVDDGVLFTKEAAVEFTKNGVQTPRLDQAITDILGAIPESLQGKKTMVKSTTEGSFLENTFNKLNALGYSPAALANSAEVYAGKMIYLKKLRQVANDALKPGVVLPDLASWTKAGFSEGQLDDLTNILKATGYNTDKATTTFLRKHGGGAVDKWRVLDWVSPDAKKGLEEYDNFWNDIVEITNRDGSQADILDALDELKIKARKNALKATTEPVRMDYSDPMWKEISNSKEQAGKFADVAADNKMMSLKIQFDRAAAELNDALNNAAFKLKGNPEAEPLIAQIQDFTGNMNRQSLNEVASKEVLERNQWAWDLTRKADNSNSATLWDEAILGPRPYSVDKQTLLDTVWQYYRNERQSIWGNYFQHFTDEALNLAKQTGHAELFGKAEASLAELQQYRNYVYNGEGIFTKTPDIKAAELGTTQNANNIRSIANTYGISSIGEAGGANKDKAVLNIINKYAPPSDAPVKKVAIAADEWVDEKGIIRKKIAPKFDFLSEEEKATRVNEIVNTDDFKALREQAKKLREQRAAAAETTPTPAPEVKLPEPEPVAAKYTRLEDVPAQEAEKAFAKHSGHKPKFFGKDGRPKPIEEGLPVHPPRDPNTSPASHVFVETKQGVLDAIEHVKQGIKERWGLKSTVNSDMGELNNLLKDLPEKVAIMKATAQNVAEKTRDFALLAYGETTNMDFAASMIYPYQFWYSRSYKNWMNRAFSTNPEIIGRYANLKEALASDQKDLPDWWKSQLNVSNLLGIETENPIYMNLEATLNPLYGLTGADFNDPDKRVNWWTSALDDIGKFGPSVWAPIQWATAAYLYTQGEKEAASLWGGRMIPQTATIKSVSSLFGTPIELDPMVQIFSGEGPFDFKASDPYETKRITRALMAMQSEGYSAEQLMEVAYTQKGELWDEAYRRAVKERAPGQISSFFFGVGFKQRTKSDITIDEFYQDYRKLIGQKDFLPPDQYRDAWDTLRDKYNKKGLSMDALLLSGKSGEERDTALAYNVLNRIPPGQMSDIAEVLGIKPEMLSSFYDNKGDLSKMTPQDKQRFMAAIVDMSAMLKMPSGSTRQEWNAAKETYASMNAELQKSYGKDILEKINTFFEVPEKERDLYLEAHPEVQQALNDQNAYIVNTPILSAYYGSLDTVGRYYTSQAYITLEKEFGKDIADKMEEYWLINDTDEKERAFYEANNLGEYYDLQKQLDKNVEKALEKEYGMEMYDVLTEWKLLKYTDKDAAKAFYKENNIKAYETRKKELNKAVDTQLMQEFGEDIKDKINQYQAIKFEQNEEARKFYRENNLEAYQARKEELLEQANQYSIQAGKNMPVGEGYTIRDEFKPAPQSPYQQEAYNFATTDTQAQQAEAIYSQLTPASQELLQEYFNGEDLPPAVERQIKYIADRMGMSQYQALRLLGVEIGN